ncbi:hypothetical protein BDN67DRAFT_1013436 [Paxillus ammoniavirescens]|nr:hypothetical protein BDN67DRAFT_1013436 [Paxillus ammoniavirescens]
MPQSPGPHHSQESREGQPGQNDDNDESLYNDGKRIQFLVQFTPLPPPQKSDNSFINFIGLCLRKFNRANLSASIKYGHLVRTPLEFKYSIPPTQLQDINLTSNDDFAEMIKQVKTRPKAEVKVVVDEIKLPSTDDDDEDEDHEELDNDAPATKKKKGPLPEEIEQAELIDQLSNMYKCEDHSCRYNICWVSETSYQHIHLTHQHLHAWAAAIQDPKNNSDLETPSNMKMFDPPAHTNDPDGALLAKRRLSTNAATSTSSPQVVVNFDGLAEVLSGLQGNQRSSAHRHRDGGPHPNGTHAQATNCSGLPPKITLEEFCLQYHLSQAVHTKLTTLSITGPHALHFISNDILSNTRSLAVGELADVRNAEA